MTEERESQKRAPKRKFTVEEDDLVRQLVAQHGSSHWDIVATHLKDRSARQCRDRWKHYLAPTVDRRPWTIEEDRLLISLATSLGPQWSLMGRYFTGRTDVNLKNRWNKLHRKAQRLGAGPLELATVPARVGLADKEHAEDHG